MVSTRGFELLVFRCHMLFRGSYYLLVWSDVLCLCATIGWGFKVRQLAVDGSMNYELGCTHTLFFLLLQRLMSPGLDHKTYYHECKLVTIAND